MPYVFFLDRGHEGRLLDYPSMVGLRNHEVVVTTDDDLSQWTFSIPHVLGLTNEPFAAPPEIAHTFTKAARKGNTLELSGSESYNSLVLPLVKAVHHFELGRGPAPGWLHFDLHLVLPLAVVDAPMVGVTVLRGTKEMRLIPWVRVLRHESPEVPSRLDEGRLFALDVVHKDYLVVYLRDHLYPFAQTLAERVGRQEKMLLTGEGFAEGLGKSSRDIADRVRPRMLVDKRKRGLNIMRIRRG